MGPSLSLGRLQLQPGAPGSQDGRKCSEETGGQALGAARDPESCGKTARSGGGHGRAHHLIGTLTEAVVQKAM